MAAPGEQMGQGRMVVVVVGLGGDSLETGMRVWDL